MEERFARWYNSFSFAIILKPFIFERACTRSLNNYLRTTCDGLLTTIMRSFHDHIFASGFQVIASDNDHMFRVATFDQLMDIHQDVVDKICSSTYSLTNWKQWPEWLQNFFLKLFFKIYAESWIFSKRNIYENKTKNQ